MNKTTGRPFILAPKVFLGGGLGPPSSYNSRSQGVMSTYFRAFWLDSVFWILPSFHLRHFCHNYRLLVPVLISMVAGCSSCGVFITCVALFIIQQWFVILILTKTLSPSHSSHAQALAGCDSAAKKKIPIIYGAFWGSRAATVVLTVIVASYEAYICRPTRLLRPCMRRREYYRLQSI